MDRSDADGLPVASSVTVLEAKSKNVPDTVSLLSIEDLTARSPGPREGES